jgi:hypothetical protein
MATTREQELKQRLEQWGVHITREEYREWKLLNLIPDGADLEVFCAELGAAWYLTRNCDFFWTEVSLGRIYMGPFVENADNPVRLLDSLRAFSPIGLPMAYETTCDWTFAYMRFLLGFGPDQPIEVFVRLGPDGCFVYTGKPSRRDRISAEGMDSHHPRRRNKALDDAHMKSHWKWPSHTVAKQRWEDSPPVAKFKREWPKDFAAMKAEIDKELKSLPPPVMAPLRPG